MSGNPMLDAQIARAVQPQFNPMAAIQQMQRPAIQPVQNPIFGGAIPMDFGLPQAAQMPVAYQNPISNFIPGQAGSQVANYQNQIANLQAQLSQAQMPTDSWGGMFEGQGE